jgi:hypothetical protein
MFNDFVGRVGVDLEREAAAFRNGCDSSPLQSLADTGSVAWRAFASRLVSLL